MGKKSSLRHIEHILFLLEGIKHTKDERDKIINSFINVKISKITEKKILNKLKYLRQKSVKEYWEKRLNVIFSSSSNMEFYREFEFDFGDGLKTKKELLLGSNTIDESIFNEDKNTIFDYLHSLIEDAIIKKEGEIKRFIEFSKKNPYLS